MMLLIDCYYVLFSFYFFICVDGALLQTKFIDEIGCVNPHLNTVSINLSVLFLELVNNYSLCLSNVPRFDVDGAAICQKFHFHSVIVQLPSQMTMTIPSLADHQWAKVIIRNAFFYLLVTINYKCDHAKANPNSKCEC